MGATLKNSDRMVFKSNLRNMIEKDLQGERRKSQTATPPTYTNTTPDSTAKKGPVRRGESSTTSSTKETNPNEMAGNFFVDGVDGTQMKTGGKNGTTSVADQLSQNPNAQTENESFASASQNFWKYVDNGDYVGALKSIQDLAQGQLREDISKKIEEFQNYANEKMLAQKEEEEDGGGYISVAKEEAAVNRGKISAEEMKPDTPMI